MPDVTPDPKPERRPRKQIRIVNPAAIVAATLARPWCCACGGQGANGHHVVARGAPYFGDDVPENIVTLCGSGTTGCHGAHHGSPYVVDVPRLRSEKPHVYYNHRERRDAEWVNKRIGEHIAGRPDAIAYVVGKLGETAGRDWLWRVYQVPNLIGGTTHAR